MITHCTTSTLRAVNLLGQLDEVSLLVDVVHVDDPHAGEAGWGERKYSTRKVVSLTGASPLVQLPQHGHQIDGGELLLHDAG